MSAVGHPISVTELLRGSVTSFSDYLAAKQQLGTLIQDEVHGQYQLGILASRIIKHAEFQRLLNLKQLGCCYKVFSEAFHNRLQHSRGVAYLSFIWALHLAQQQREKGQSPHTWLTPLDIELIELAGLCHDLGHGPFSHVFEAFIVKSLGIHHWEHEALSGLLLKHMLSDLFIQEGLLTETDLRRHHQQWQQQKQQQLQEWEQKQLLLQQGQQQQQQQQLFTPGRKFAQLPDVVQLLYRLHGAIEDLIKGKGVSGYWRDKKFVLQIVASVIDADKIEYLLRDLLRTGATLLEALQELTDGNGTGCHHPLRQGLPDFVALIHDSRIMNDCICFSKATQPLLQQLLRARRLMHEHVYQKADIKGFELMLAHTLQKTAGCLDLNWLRQHGSIGQASFDEEQTFVRYFCGLTDALLDEARRRALHNSAGDSDRQLALQIVQAFDRGEAYESVEEEDVKGLVAASMKAEAIEQAILDCLASSSNSSSSSSSGRERLSPGDIKVLYIKLDYTNGAEDPLKDLWFWSEGPHGTLIAEQGSWSEDNKPAFITRKVRVYLTKLCSEQEQARHCAALQLALQQVISQTAAAAAAAQQDAGAEAAAAAAEQDAAAAAEADTEAVDMVEATDEEEQLVLRLEDEDEEMQAELLSLTPAPAAAAATAATAVTGFGDQSLTPTPAPAAAAAVGYGDSSGFAAWPSVVPFSQLSSQVPEFTQQQEQVLMSTQAAAAAAAMDGDSMGDMSPVRQFPGFAAAVVSPVLVTPQQQQQDWQQQQQRRRQILLPFDQQAAAGDSAMQQYGSLEPAATMVSSVGALDTAAAAAAAETTPAAAAAGDKRVPHAVARVAFECMGLKVHDDTDSKKVDGQAKKRLKTAAGAKR